MKKKIVKVLALLLAVLMALSGCSSGPSEQTTVDLKSDVGEIAQSPEEKTVLRVATISTDNVAFRELIGHIQSWALKFKFKHKNVNIVFESLSATERLRTELMAGKGPDVLLLPTQGYWEPLNGEHSVGVTLIRDVNQAMRNGIFYDITEFYDADEELNKDSFVPAVMEAGVVDGKRYVLPLRYNMLAAYVDLEMFAETGLSTDIFEKDIIGFWNALTEHGDGLTASSALIRSGRHSELNLIGDLIDYDKQEVLLTKEELVTYLKAQQDFLVTRGLNPVSVQSLLHNYYPVSPQANPYGEPATWMGTDNCMNVGQLAYAIHNAVIAEAEGIELGMFPLRSTDGSVTADITFFGAVSGGCKNPELAYEFLRYFLTEESQWEQNVTSTSINDSCFMAAGWPVLVKGSADAMYKRLKRWTYPIALKDRPDATAADIEPYTEDDIPILNVTIDKARFPTGLESKFRDIVAFNPFTAEREAGKTLTREEMAEWAKLINIERMAEDFIEDLEWHVGEG